MYASEADNKLFPVASAFWGVEDTEWAPGQARAVLHGGTGQQFPSRQEPDAQPAQLTRAEWSALLAGLPIDDALKLPTQARQALLVAFNDDLSSSSSESSSEEEEEPAESAKSAAAGAVQGGISHPHSASLERRAGHKKGGSGQHSKTVVEVAKLESLREPGAATGASAASVSTAGGTSSRRTTTTKQLSRKMNHRIRRCQCDCGIVSECGDWCSFACLPNLFGEDADDTESDSASEEEDEDVDAVDTDASFGGLHSGGISGRWTKPKRYRPTGCAGCVARLGDLLSRARRWRAAIVLLITLGAVSPILISERNVIDDVGSVVVTMGESIALFVGIVMAIEFVLRFVGSASYVCTGRAIVLVSPTPEDIASDAALAAELNDSTGSGPLPGETVSTSAVVAAAATDSAWALVGRGMWRTLDMVILLASAILLLLSSTAEADHLLYHDWSAIVAVRFVFVVPWRKILRGDPTTADGHDHSEDLELRRRLHARPHHHHHTEATEHHLRP
jgi:hypothetical protein